MVGDVNPAPVERPPEDVQATFCATLVDEWIRLGIGHAVVAPGSRSTPMALALAERSELAVHVVHDERVAAFVALGLGLEGTPALLLCTSGTAAANFFPAVVEAGLSEVPLIVVTADRPAELRGVGAPQTIDQVDLYGRHVRWSRDAGVAVDAERTLWRSLAQDAWTHSVDGPVQLNLPFREPLIGRAGDLPPVESKTTEAVRPARFSGATLPSLGTARGVILVGGRSGVDASSVAALQARTGWPVIADPISGMRELPGSLAAADAILRSDSFVATHVPDVIVRIGRPASSKVLAQWSASSGCPIVQVGGPGVIDPERNVVAVCSIDEAIASVPSAPAAVRPGAWLAAWLGAEELAQRTIDEWLGASDTLTEPAVARTIATHLPADADLTVASSMPIRDLEWFGGPTARAHANRGANGIDGVTSTALGRAMAGGPSVVLIGDLAFVHDSNALVGLMDRGVDLRIVVVDNDGGGIFSFLPQATALTTERFEQLFGTPLGTDVLALAAAHGIPTASATTVAELVTQMAEAGPWVCRVPSDRTHNVEVHRDLHAAIVTALDS